MVPGVPGAQKDGLYPGTFILYPAAILCRHCPVFKSAIIGYKVEFAAEAQLQWIFYHLSPWDDLPCPFVLCYSWWGDGHQPRAGAVQAEFCSAL